jgi:hypothetical protein
MTNTLTASATQTPERIDPDGAWAMSTSVDLQECDPRMIRSRLRIREYVLRLCDLIGMKRLGETQIVQVLEGHMAGLSMLQLFEACLVSGRFANDTNGAHLDISSCQAYDAAVIERFSREFFSASASRAHTTLPRTTPQIRARGSHRQSAVEARTRSARPGGPPAASAPGVPR